VTPLRRLALRRGRLDDADRLLDWANDVVTRAASFGRPVVGREAHVAWLADTLARDDRRLWVVEEAGLPIGQVRVDRGVDGTGMISIGLAPGARGRGAGARVLDAALEAAVAELGIRRFRAIVREDNAASRRLFERAGFRLVDRAPSAGSTGALRYEKDVPPPA
jgi:RimJ/RimL family protein N-acetyltransferase